MSASKSNTLIAVATACALSATLVTTALAGPHMGMRAPMRMGPPLHLSAPAPTSTPRQVTTARKATTTHPTGQPNQTCGSATAPQTPGNASTAPGSAFNPNGTAGGVYAGQQPQNSGNPKSVSQYDVACSKQK